MGTGEKEKRSSQGNVDPQAHSNNLFSLPVSCHSTSISLVYVPVLIKKKASHRGGRKIEARVEICGQNL